MSLLRIIIILLLLSVLLLSIWSCAPEGHIIDNKPTSITVIKTPTLIGIATSTTVSATRTPFPSWNRSSIELKECEVSSEKYLEWSEAQECFGLPLPDWREKGPKQRGEHFYPENPPQNAVFEGIRLRIDKDIYEARQTGYYGDSEEPLEFSLFRNNIPLITLRSSFTTYNPNVSLLSVGKQIVWEFANPKHPTVILGRSDLRDVYDLEAAYVPGKLSEELVFVAKKKNGKYIVFYDGRKISPEYDKIEIAYCCGLSAYSIQPRESSYWFWAKRENRYYLVVILEK